MPEEEKKLVEVWKIQMFTPNIVGEKGENVIYFEAQWPLVAHRAVVDVISISFTPEFNLMKL